MHPVLQVESPIWLEPVRRRECIAAKPRRQICTAPSKKKLFLTGQKLHEWTLGTALKRPLQNETEGPGLLQMVLAMMGP